MDDHYRFVETSHGRSSYLELSHDGPDVVMLHAPGFCSASMERVAGQAGLKAHVVSLDLPAHGSSEVDVTDASGAASWLEEVLDALDLSRPMMLGCDMSAFTVAAVAAGSIEVSGLTLVGGYLLMDRSTAAEQLDFMTSEQVLGAMARRMSLGREGDGPEAMRTAALDLAENAKRDWLIEDHAEAFADKIVTVFHVDDGGHWVRRPTPQNYARLHTIDPGADPYPERDLLKRIDAPVRVLVGSDGVGGDAVAVAREELHDRDLHIDVVPGGGNNLAMTRTTDVASYLREVLTSIE